MRDASAKGISSLWRYPSKTRAYIERRLIQKGKLELALEGSNQRRSLGDLLTEGVGAGRWGWSSEASNQGWSFGNLLIGGFWAGFGGLKPEEAAARHSEDLKKSFRNTLRKQSASVSFLAHSENRFSEAVAGRFPKFFPCLHNFPLAPNH